MTGMVSLPSGEGGACQLPWFHVEQVDRAKETCRVDSRSKGHRPRGMFPVEQFFCEQEAAEHRTVQAECPVPQDLQRGSKCSTWNREDFPQASPALSLFHVKHLASPFRLCYFRNVWGRSLARVIAVANQKGGVGKTTTAVNLAACLATANQPTLLVDCDSQANATAAIGFQKDPSRHTMYQALILGEAFEKIVQKSQVEGLDVVPADKNLAGAAVELVNSDQREYKLQGFLESVREKYKFILLDCPPALDLLTLNALVSADAVLVPIQCEYLALEGVSELLDTLMRIRRTLNPKLEVEGILLTMYDERTTLARQVATDLRSFFGTQVFQSVIARNVRLAEAPSFGKPIIFYDMHSKGAEGYTQLAQEVIANAEKRVGTGARSANSGA
jgi:chromosome partitioning protein